MKTKYFFLLLVIFTLASCNKKSEQSFCGEDNIDITANKWLNQINMQDHFLCFEEDGTGWEAVINDNVDQWHSYFPKKRFSYNIDTKKKVIEITYNKNKQKVVWAYILRNEGKRTLEIEGTEYVDATKELNQFDSRLWDNVNATVETFNEVYKMYQDK